MGVLMTKVKEEVTDRLDDHIPEEAIELLFGSDGDIAFTMPETGTSDVQTELDKQTSQIDITQYDFPFENLVFEGGGSKGVSYCGAIEVLEEIGMMKNIRRVAGTSVGAITAAFIAVGYTSKQMKEILSIDLSPLIYDSTLGYVTLLPSLLLKYGWNPAQKLVHWIGQKLDDKTRAYGINDITFEQLYRLYNIELCITATNVNMMSMEFFHPKTTPTVKVKDALRMSISLPALLIPKKLRMCGNEDIYIDGGVLCNYPICCFDGWWLSMEKGDCFFERMHPLHMIPTLFEKKEQFEPYNEKTIGFIVYSDGDHDYFRDKVEERKGLELDEFPNTKLGVAAKKAREARLKKDMRLAKNEKANTRAVEKFLDVLKKHNVNMDDEIDMEELRAALNDDEFRDYKIALFGKNISAEEAMNKIDLDHDKKIKYYELDRFLGSMGQSLQSQFLGYKRLRISSFREFVGAVGETLISNAQRLYVEDRDAERTVGINTGYIETTNFVMAPQDREYLYQRGRKSTEVFLKQYAAKNNLPRKQ